MKRVISFHESTFQPWFNDKTLEKSSELYTPQTQSLLEEKDDIQFWKEDYPYPTPHAESILQSLNVNRSFRERGKRGFIYRTCKLKITFESKDDRGRFELLAREFQRVFNRLVDEYSAHPEIVYKRGLNECAKMMKSERNKNMCPYDIFYLAIAEFYNRFQGQRMTHNFEDNFDDKKLPKIYKLRHAHRFHVSGISITFVDGVKWTICRRKFNVCFQMSSHGKIKLDQFGKCRPFFKFVFLDGHWYACVTYKTEPNYQVLPRTTIGSIDFGVRKFATVYDPMRQRILTIGTKMNRYLKRAFNVSRALQIELERKRKERKYKCGGYGRRQLQRKRNKLFTKIRHKVDQFHYNVIHRLCREYDTIITCPFKTGRLVSKASNPLTKFQLIHFRHTQFNHRLSQVVADKFSHVQVLEITEEYTSRTCSSCGFLNNSSSEEWFICNKCGVEMDRDQNGSKNIMLKSLS